MKVETLKHFACVGVGVGPANLSVASLFYSHPGLPIRFLEKRTEFGWHDGQQFEGATLQVSIFKDLVTLSDPTSELSFLSYLHAHGRLYHFINAQFDRVPRQEFRNYLEWACRKNENIVFGEEVLSVDFDGVFVVRTDRGVMTADNISVGVGTEPWYPLPPGAASGPGRFHVSDFKDRARHLDGKRVAVVGGGQSGAEAFLELISRPAQERPRRVTWISRRENFFPLDDSPFINDYYTPSFSDYFFHLERPARESFNQLHVLTSDGISESTLREIYQRAYVLRFVEGVPDVFALYPNREVKEVSEASDLTITMAHSDFSDTAEQIEADVIIWATGSRSARTDFLAPIAHRLEQEGSEYKVDESFAVLWDGPPGKNIFMQNAARQQRGLADPNLSLLAWRAQRIVDRILGARTSKEIPSFIEWSAKASPELTESSAQ